ncbi:TonB family protein [Natronospira proteinivora]|uniref:TonB family protein n=1 Tax=Natronospira proteinivora TaxID=1807133 RepID=A0ABT1GAQ1_9GAMM|nr:TonB family protein [Natronospira proteinivora]MCP1728387.1 TonB family protein [Natronospira proteinivora]
MLWLRMLICVLIASVVVLTMAAVGVRWFYDRDQQEESAAEFIEQVGLTGLFDGPGGSERERDARREFVRQGPQERERPTPAVEVPEREITGFVQVEFTVFPDGRVDEVEVVGARPEGIYEEQALQQVEAADYTGQVSPAEEDGERRTEIVEFTVPASEMER